MNTDRTIPTPLTALDSSPDREADGPSVAADDLLSRLDGDVAAAGGEWQIDPSQKDAIGHTMFDLPNSEDNSVTVLLPREHLQRVPSQVLVRIKSKDERSYLGTVVRGPFAEPDGLRGDSSMLVTVVTRGGIFTPNYHGRVQVAVLGEELSDGTLVPPRFRPLPNSPAFVLGDEETARVLHAEGDLRLGQVVGHENVVVHIPSNSKTVLPRHTAILGTTGGGKSTTVARLIQQAQVAGCAVILLDVEGEYTTLHQPTEDPRMLRALGQRGLVPAGVPNTTVYHLVGRETANPDHPRPRPFTLQFARLSPYAAIEIVDLSEAQSERFLKAYDVAKILLRDLGIFPERGNADQERIALELDEFERGYPRLTLSFLLDVVGACAHLADKQSEDTFEPFDSSLKGEEAKKKLFQRIRGGNVPAHVLSWRALQGRLYRLKRLTVFDRNEAKPLIYKQLLRPGTVSIVDLSDTGSPVLNNIVIADLLQGIQQAQDDAYAEYEQARRAGRPTTPLTRALLVIEEAHEFLSAQRIAKMENLFQQVARIARRGRKRWLGLVFVSQLPQHLPREVFGLVNSYVLHKISDPQVVSSLERTVSGIDEALWNRLPGLAPGQAIVSFPHLARPLLVAVDPTPAQLRLVD